MTAFALPPPMAASSFTGAAVSSVAATPLRVSRRAPARRAAVTMIKNPFANEGNASGETDDSSFMPPQAGDPGYVPLPPVPKGFGMTKSESKADAEPEEEEAAVEAKKPAAKAAPAKKPAAAAGKKAAPAKTVTPKAKGDGGSGAVKLPVSGGKGGDKRGIDLLREDLFKNAPTAAGVGRQDVGAVMKPMAGEPGYKPAAYETVKVSDLGISPFPDDANAVGKVGGIESIKKAAFEVKQGRKTADEVKAEVLKKGAFKVEKKPEAAASALKVEEVKEEKVEKVYDIPDYLKPIPEDTPRKGYTWKNYVGR